MLQLFRGLHDRYGDCLIEAFKAVNRGSQVPQRESARYVKPDEKYRAGAWDLLQPGTVPSVKEIEEKCGLRGLKKALDSIQDKFVEIEQQRVALHGLVKRF